MKKLSQTKVSENQSDWIRKLSILGICSGCVVIALVFSMVNTALPVIQNELGISVNATQWMMNVFGIINCAILVTCGRLADIYGRKKIFIIGLISSWIAMISGGFCHSALGLIVCMSFAGIGNAIILPVSQALLVSEYPEEQRGRAIGVWAAALAAALAVGPVLGGVISGCIGWKWVYWINVPVIAISIALVCMCSRESRNTEDSPDVDYLGMFFLGLSIASFALFLTEYSSLPAYLKVSLPFITLASVLLLWKTEKSFSSPILRGDLLRNKQFLAASLANGCLVFYIWSIFFLLPLYLQSTRGLSSLMSGLMMLGITLPVAILSPPIGRLYHPRTASIWIVAGFALMLISTIFQSLFQEDTGLLFIALATTFYGVADSFIWGPSTTAAVSTLSVQRAGISSGTFVTIQEIGGILGLATTVTVARNGETFMQGFHQSMLILVCVGILGCFCGAYLFVSRKKLGVSVE